MSQHHDPVHPDAEHLTAEVLADLDLGLLDDDSAAHAQHHLAHCEPCRQLQGDLASLTDVLHGLTDSGTEPMPDEVWQQLAGALADEPVATPSGSATVVPLATERARRRRPGIGLVAGAAGVALLGAIVVSVMSNGTAVNTASTDSASTGGAQAEGAPADSAEVFAATRSGTQYRQEQLDEQVIELVAARRATTPTADASASPDASVTSTASPSASMVPNSDGPDPGVVSKMLRTSGPMATDPAAAQACLEDYLDVGGITPLAIDIGLWQGKPAAVIVLPLPDPDNVQVWIINPTCDGGALQDPTYYFATVSR